MAWTVDGAARIPAVLRTLSLYREILSGTGEGAPVVHSRHAQFGVRLASEQAQQPSALNLPERRGARLPSRRFRNGPMGEVLRPTRTRSFRVREGLNGTKMRQIITDEECSMHVLLSAENTCSNNQYWI